MSDLHDMELADTIQDMMLRGRIRSSIHGDGTFDEDEYADLVVREVKRAKASHDKMVNDTQPK